MKNLIITLITLLAINSNTAIAQKAKKTKTVIIKTSTECGMCKTRIEKAMAYEKGIVSSNLNIDKAELTVTYKPHKTDPDKIRLAISSIGYDADNLKANQKAHDDLPDCCQKDGMNH